MAEPVERQKTGGPVHTDFPFFCVAPFGIRAACRQGGGPPEPCRENRACQRPMMFHQTMPTVACGAGNDELWGTGPGQADDQAAGGRRHGS